MTTSNAIAADANVALEPVDTPKRAYAFDVLVFRDGDRYSAIARDVPGVVSAGDTLDEALINIREAFEGVIEAYDEDGEPLPRRVEPEQIGGSELRVVRVTIP